MPDDEVTHCYCGNSSDTPHECPYNEGMGGFSRLCDCCELCTRECEEDL